MDCVPSTIFQIVQDYFSRRFINQNWIKEKVNLSYKRLTLKKKIDLRSGIY